MCIYHQLWKICDKYKQTLLFPTPETPTPDWTEFSRLDDGGQVERNTNWLDDAALGKENRLWGHTPGWTLGRTEWVNGEVSGIWDQRRPVPHFSGSNKTPVEKWLRSEQKGPYTASLTSCDPTGQEAVEALHIPTGTWRLMRLPPPLRGPITPATDKRFITFSVSPTASEKMQREAYPKGPSEWEEAAIVARLSWLSADYLTGVRLMTVTRCSSAQPTSWHSSLPLTQSSDKIPGEGDERTANWLRLSFWHPKGGILY